MKACERCETSPPTSLSVHVEGRLMSTVAEAIGWVVLGFWGVLSVILVVVTTVRAAREWLADWNVTIIRKEW